MITDARRLERGTRIDADVCLVGAGAAGLTLATELDGRGLRVVLLESGGLEPSDEVQSLNHGSVRGEPYPLAESRVRCFGGTTHRWGGVCVPLDPCDFERRDWVPHSGWPFPRVALEPFYERARSVCALPDAGPSEPGAPRAGPRGAPALPAGGPLALRPVQYGGALRFGETFRAALARSRQVEVLLHATATRLVPDRSGRQVESLRLQCLEGNELWVHPRCAVLACGGIENTRLLLVSPGPGGTALGNAHDLVGRFFMEHYYLGAGVLRGAPGVRLDAFTEGRRIGAGRSVATLALSEETRRRHRLLDLNVRLYPYSDVDRSDAVAAFKTCWDAAQRWSRPPQPGRRLAALASDPAALGRYLAWRAATRIARDPRRRQAGYLYAGTEQEPDPENRVTLGPGRDRLGLPLPRIRLRLSRRHWESYGRAVALVADALERLGIGRLERDVGWERTDELGPKFGAHHMGTTRMHADPRQGVVDADGRVHGVENLFVAGSSVFPTGGSANPTFTIVALAIRLADHVDAMLRSAPRAEVA